ncbi:MAG: hypothetical protein AAGF85_00630 [Bacteroidota bacterium]
MENKRPELSKAVAAVYDCTITPTEVLVPIKKDGKIVYPLKRLRVDLTKATLKQAEALVANGFKYLVKKKSASSSSSTGDKK